MMLIKEILNKIMLKELTIKKLGYEWDSKQSIYRYVGEDREPLDLDFSTLILKTARCQ